MNLLNNTKVHTYIYYYVYIQYALLVYFMYNDYAGILEYLVSSPLVHW